MRIMKIVLFFAVASLAIVSCKDKDKLSKKTLLTQKPWVFVKIEEKEDNGPWQNIFAQFPECQKDNQMTFTTDMNVNVTEGNNACPGNTPHQVLETAAWSLSEGETKITIDGETFTIEQLDGNTLILSLTETAAGITYSSKATLGH